MFKEMVANYGMKGKPSTTYNPQSNGIIERVHQTLTNCFRTFELENSELDEHDPSSSFIAATCFAVRATSHTTMKASPGQLVFGRDMILPIRYLADWEYLRQVRQKQMTRDNQRENKNRLEHKYSEGDKVLLTKPGIQPKMDAPRTGPHVISKVWSNGTVTLQQGAVSKRVNI